MSSWKKDKGQTTLPCIYIPFNEIDKESEYVPIRVGMSLLRWNRSEDFEHVLDNDGHLSFTGSTPASGKWMYIFQDNSTTEHFSRHDDVLSPAANIGKHIVTFFKIKIGAGAAGQAMIMIMFSAFDGPGGKGGWQLHAGFSNRNITLRTVPYGTAWAGGTPTTSPNQIYEVDTWHQMMIDQHVVSANKITTRIWIASADGVIGNDGEELFEQEFEGALPELISGSCCIGHGGGATFDIKDYLALTTTEDPASSIFPALREWYSNPNNEYQFPNFLRAPITKAAAREVKHYASSWALNGVENDSKIKSMYDFWTRWGLQNSAFDGIHLGLGINAFQPTAAGYLINELREFADWCNVKNIKLKILVNDQTYRTASELPDHFPHWKKCESINGGEPVYSRSASYWDEIDTFDIDSEIFQNATWPIYNASRENSGTYRWFHHIWHIVNALKDKPAFAGFTLGETSGDAIGKKDSEFGNEPGESNRCGIYGITDANGIYLINKSYSRLKQRLYYLKAMRMIADQLKGRPDVMCSLQINYIRGSIPGNHSPSYNKASRTFSVPNATDSMFRNGDAMFLLSNYPIAVGAGMNADTTYYVVQQSANSWKVAVTPDGDPVEFSQDIPTNNIWVSTIDHHMEIYIDHSRDVSVHNGYQLTDINREVRLMAEGMHQYGFVASGPDVITGAVEDPLYYEGPYIEGMKQFSPVEIRLDMLHGRRWFSDLGPMKSCEIQSQDSSYQGKKNSILTQILPMYAPSYAGDEYSLGQIYRYAVDRLQVSDIVWFLNNANDQKALPDLIREISQ